MRPRDVVALVSTYAEPEPVGGNRTLAAQALALKAMNVPIELLTWPVRDSWRGPLATRGDGQLAGMPELYVERTGLPYHVVSLPGIWSERIPTEREWESAVQWGMAALSELQPRIVHQQFWQSMWWMMDASIRLKIPTIYSVHDYGIACLRTVLVTGWDNLCDGIVEVAKCSRCILAGRNLLGKANEFFANLPLADRLLAALFGSRGDGPLARKSGIRMPVDRRVELTIERCRRILSQLDALIVTSPFARDFYLQFGVPRSRIHIIPWFYAQEVLTQSSSAPADSLRLAFVGRISPEKGVHVLLQALEKTRTSRRLVLKILGSTDTPYAKELMRRYPHKCGDCDLSWCGWLPNARLHEFYSDIDVAVVPSLWYDNTPLALVEALAFGNPVICTDVPSMTHLVQHGVNGLTFPIGDAAVLARRIEQLADAPDLVHQLAKGTRNVPSVREYCQKLSEVYCRVIRGGLGQI